MAIIFHLDGVLLATEPDGVRLRPGALAATDVAAAGPWAVVSSGEPQRAHDVLVELGSYAPPVVIGGVDVAQDTPTPEGYRAAAAELGLAPPLCLVVEHAPMGIASARAAGMVVMAVATTHAREELTAADLVMDDLVAARPLLENWVEERNRGRT